MAADLGIKEKDRLQIVNGLSRLLADTYTLYLKTHNFHWNVTGPMFQTLHLMFETQYTEMWTNVDLIAERIRSLDAPTPGTYAQFTKLASIKETAGVPNAQDMIKILLEGHEAVTRTARKVFPAAESGQRPADHGPSDAAHGGAREDCLDAAQPAGEVIPPGARTGSASPLPEPRRGV